MFEGKRCACCDRYKPPGDFSKNRSRPDGLCHYCRPCKAAAAAKRYEARPETIRKAARDWYARNPERGKARAKKYREENHERVCTAGREARRRARAEDPEYFRRQFREWRMLNAERMREHDRRRKAAIKHGCRIYPFSVEQLAAKVAYWGGKCWMCGAPYEQIDHVKPVAKGGPHMLANLRPACRPCNQEKKARWPLAG